MRADVAVSRFSWMRWVLYQVLKPRTSKMVHRILLDIPPSTRTVCDIGCGNGQIAREINRAGFAVTAVDTVDLKFFPDFKTVVFDGKKLPFHDDAFDVAILIVVLHHTRDPRALIEEALRVSPRVLIIEDVIRSPLHAVATKLLDSFLNLEFIDHPHTNKSHEGWMDLFRSLNVKATMTRAAWDFAWMWQVSYLLEKNSPLKNERPK